MTRITIIASGTRGGAFFATSAATAGDVNGDGYDDVIIGAPCHNSDLTAPGRAYVYYGSASGIDETQADWVYDYPWQWSLFSWYVSTAGDVNHDGYDDVIIGAPYYSDGVCDLSAHRPHL